MGKTLPCGPTFLCGPAATYLAHGPSASASASAGAGAGAGGARGAHGASRFTYYLPPPYPPRHG